MKGLATKDKQKTVSILFLTFLGFISPFFLSAQQINVNTKVDSNSILIGSPFHYHIQVKHNRNTKVEWPRYGDTLGSFDILSKNKIDSAIDGETIIQSQKLTLTSFDQGRQVIPSIKFNYHQKGDTTVYSINTDTFHVRVRLMAVDTSKNIKPIKGIRDIPLTFAEIWPYLAIGLGVILLAVLGFWLYRRWKRKPAQEPMPVPERPPHEIAIEKLENLKSEQLWQKGHIKDYHDQLTDIVREYLEKVFQIHALEMTTDEILQQLRDRPISQHQKDKLKQIFEKADLAKFAKANPSPEENEEAMNVAFEFIRETKGE